MNNTKIAAALLLPTHLCSIHSQPAVQHAGPTKLLLDDEATRAVNDSGRIRIGAAFRLVTQR